MACFQISPFWTGIQNVEFEQATRNQGSRERLDQILMSKLELRLHFPIANANDQFLNHWIARVAENSARILTIHGLRLHHEQFWR